MQLSDYKPRSKLVTKVTQIKQPRFPVIDAHNHLGDDFGGGWIHKPVADLLDRLDQTNVRMYVDLDGGWGEDILYQHLDHFKNAAPERFMVFGGVNWNAWADHGDGFPEWAAGRLREQVRRGAQGLKIWKPFGLSIRDPQYNLVKIDDPRLDPIWQTAGELKLPVLIHVADPVAFFDPVDETNERWEDLQGNPDWQFTSPPFPSFLSLMEGLANMVARNHDTTYIGAHVGCYAENLAWVGALLDRCPNFYVDISARLGELSRQPYSSRKFFIQYADRILFGTDSGPDLDSYQVHFRYLETDDEYFNYMPGDVPGMGRWYAYGLYLPDDVLKKVYHQNAMRVLGIKELP
jgi:predicted TIM-barrel fold metal-dependent hydrolase